MVVYTTTHACIWHLSALVWLSLLFISAVGLETIEEHHKDEKVQRFDTTLVNMTKMKAFQDFWESSDAKLQYEGRIFTHIDAISDWIGCEKWGDTIVDAEAYTQLPTAEDYSILFEAYRYAMSNRPKQEQIARPAPVHEYNPDVFSVEVEVRSIPHTGRGLFAAQDISRGTLISRPVNALEFYTEESFRDFVVYVLSRGSKFICDVFLWIYVVKKSPTEYCVCIEADHTSLYNDGDWDAEEDPEKIELKEEEYECDTAEGTCKRTDRVLSDVNVGQLQFTYGCQEPPVYALRDIQEGEELLMSYSDFSEPEGWSELGIWD